VPKKLQATEQAKKAAEARAYLRSRTRAAKNLARLRLTNKGVDTQATDNGAPPRYVVQIGDVEAAGQGAWVECKMFIPEDDLEVEYEYIKTLGLK
jgi:hypothetical protein